MQHFRNSILIAYTLEDISGFSDIDTAKIGQTIQDFAKGLKRIPASVSESIPVSDGETVAEHDPVSEAKPVSE